MNASDPLPVSTGRSQIGIVQTMLLVLGLFACYALSPGPVLKVLGPFPAPPVNLEKVYAPLIYLYEEVPAVHDFYEWYLALWDAP